MRADRNAQVGVRPALIVPIAVLLAGLFLSPSARADEVGHYIPGLVGLKAAVTPPPGSYYGNLTLSYTFGQLNDGDGEGRPFEGDINILGNVSSFIYVTGAKVLGGRYGVQLNVPVTNRAYILDASSILREGKTGVADIYVQPFTLGWSDGGNHVSLRYGFFAPTGRFERGGLDNTGKGFWTHMFSLGDTYTFGDEKRWHGSGMFRYETHTKKENADVTAGDNVQLEWGFGRKLGERIDLGLTGASTWQVSDEKGALAAMNRYSAHAVGAEIQYAFPKPTLSLRFRSNFDVAATNRAQGYLLAFMLVWRP